MILIRYFLCKRSIARLNHYLVSKAEFTIVPWSDYRTDKVVT